MPLEFLALGSLEVRRDGQRLELGPRRQRLVLARLLVDFGRTVSTDRLIEDVWDGNPPEGALRTLRSYLSRLRSSLHPPEVIVTKAPGYTLLADPASVDVTRFSTLAAEGRELLARRNARAASERLEEALATWRGRAFDDVRQVSFVLAEAARLEEQRVAALEDRLEAELQLGRHASVLPEIEWLVQENPLRERLWRHLMLALYRSNRQADALAAYARARTLLGEELGLEPGEDLRHLERTILRQEVDPPELDSPHNLPSPLTTLIGRELEVSHTLRDLDENRLVTLTGTGGSGKTRIAIEVGRRALSRFPDGVWLVDLAPLSNPSLVPEAVATAVRLQERTLRPRAEMLREHLAGVEALILLDNCEHLVEACATLVSDLLPSCPRLRVLATSREPLGVTGERIREVPPLPSPPPDDRKSPETYDSVRLFLARSSSDVPSTSLGAVAEICRELDGLPLAIEIAAAQTNVLPPEEILVRLTDRFRLLDYWSRSAASRHRSLAASLDWSYALLRPLERTLFHALGVFAGGFTVAAVQDVAELEQDALPIIRRLVDASLVIRDQRADRLRFRLLETVRQYALARASATGDLEAISRRHARYFLTMAGAAFHALNTSDEPVRYAALDSDHANVRTALDLAVRTKDDELLTRLARGMGQFWLTRWHLDEAQLWLEKAIERGDRQPIHIRADLLGLLGAVQLRRRSLDRAIELLEQAIELSRSSPEPTSADRWMHHLAMCWQARGDFPRMRAVLAEAIALSTARGDRFSTSHHVGTLADTALVEGRFDEAEALYDEAWALAQPAPAVHRVAYLESVARLAFAQGQLEAAKERAERGLESARELGDEWHVGLCFTVLGAAAARTGDPAGAVRSLRAGLDILWRIRAVSGVADALDVIAVLVAAPSDDERAALLLAAARLLREAHGSPPGSQSWSFLAPEAEAVLRRVGRPVDDPPPPETAVELALELLPSS